MRPRAIFFDMDDTLLDTSGGVAESWRAVCHAFAPELGCDPDELNTAIRTRMVEFWKDEAAVEHWRTRLDDARTHNVREALAAKGLNPALAPRLSDCYWDEQSNRMRLFDDALETLDRLRDAGFHLGLLTNGPARMQRWKLGRFPLAERVDVVVIEGEFGHGKPDARVFQHALASVGANPEEAWHVGDNLYADIRGAQGAGIHATWIHRDRLELKDDAPAVPDRVIGHLAELREALGL
ncbi:MAG TPA: HAD family hydrolase [Tepidiformaceae bacterium]|nr:HAD family hydrolase [Tepidiformaceae bacterium]